MLGNFLITKMIPSKEYNKYMYIIEDHLPHAYIISAKNEKEATIKGYNEFGVGSIIYCCEYKA